MNVNDVITVVNAVGLTLFLVLLGGILALLARRVYMYRVAAMALPVILKRGMVLFMALAVLGAETATLRILGIDLMDPGLQLARLVFIIQSNMVLDAAFLYYLKTELFDMDDPSKP